MNETTIYNKAEQDAKRLESLNADMWKMIEDANKVRTSLFIELNELGYSATNLDDLLNYAKFNTAMTRYNQINDFLKFNFNTQFLKQ